MIGQITDEEQRLLDVWMEDPHNQKLMKDFLKRRDMLSIYSLPKSHSVMGNPFEQDNMSIISGNNSAKEEEDNKVEPTWIMAGNEMTGDKSSTSVSEEGFTEEEDDNEKHKSIALWLKVAGIAAVAIFAFMLGNQWLYRPTC